jgi:NADPH2:quinone reductase
MTAAMQDMFAAVLAGELEPVAGGSYPLADARRAHEDIRGRGTVGKLVLVP